ncbi:hypothetical protein [Anaerosoma tenue]|uniref:hypothetical protein n=1 Tax=Anaerosoma tenue TaxID=2933588 RepID=UPI002260D8A7|nr:hypothetical protein [Anaerosoma tenue]MCK8114835.1 hypothetical protein [Anaerosoma tenue]
MVALVVLAGKVMLVALTATALALGAIQAGGGMSRYASAARTVEDRFHDESTDMDEIQKARTEGMTDAVVGTAKVAMAAQTIASPDLPVNPVGIGFTDAMSAAQVAIEQYEGAGAGAEANVGADANAAAGAGGQSAGEVAGEAADTLNNQGVGAAVSPDGSVPVEQARETYYIAWYCKDFGWEPIYITTVERFKADEMAYTYPGGGIDPDVPLVKVPLTGAFSSEEEARKAVYGMMSNPRPGGGIYAGVPFADIGDQTHSLEFCGGLEWWQ